MLRIRVPATSANLGSGFDCMGLALPICNEIAVRAAEELVIHTDAGLPTDERNLIVRSMKSAYERMGRQFRPVELWQTNGIPSTSGLGSSAACIVAGIVAANEIEGGIFSEQELLDLATDLDGHPDNVARAARGYRGERAQRRTRPRVPRVGCAVSSCAPDPRFSAVHAQEPRRSARRIRERTSWRRSRMR